MIRLSLVLSLTFLLQSTAKSQILPNSPRAYKSVMRVKKTNLCYLLTKQMEGGQPSDLLSFSFRDFIYDYPKAPDDPMKLEVVKILKNYQDCQGAGGLKIKFSLAGQAIKTETHCANNRYPTSKNPVYQCYLVETADQKGKSCYDVKFFELLERQLDQPGPIAATDVRSKKTEKVCL